MDNEKPKRIRTAHIAFVQKTMEGATGILVKPITYKIHQGKTYGIEIYREQKPGNYPKTGWNNSGKHYAESAIMQFSLYGSLWVQWCRKRLGCCILDLVDTQKFFISPRPPHSCLDLPCSMVCIFQAVASSCQQCFMKVWVSVLLIFRAVADPRNSAISAKSREIPKKTRNTAKSAGNISKYMSAKHI